MIVLTRIKQSFQQVVDDKIYNLPSGVQKIRYIQTATIYVKLVVRYVIKCTIIALKDKQNITTYPD